MTVSTAVLLESFPQGKQMNFTWSYYAQFWRNTGLDTLPPAQFSSQIGAAQFQEEPLDWIISFGSFKEMSHQGSITIPDNRTLEISVTANYPSPVPSSQKLWFHVHSIMLKFDDAPQVFTEPDQGRMYTPSQMAALGVTLGVVIIALSAFPIYRLKPWKPQDGQKMGRYGSGYDQANK
ncbi:hypothetical protein FRC19_009607 [Serendipita sp. 401]|nr:hypothetical protein FRC19_009607 [Serendipita sp. 401]